MTYSDFKLNILCGDSDHLKKRYSSPPISISRILFGRSSIVGCSGLEVHLVMVCGCSVGWKGSISGMMVVEFSSDSDEEFDRNT